MNQTTTESIEHTARIHSIPLYDVCRPLGDEFAQVIRTFCPDLIIASCFPWRIPAMIRDTAPLGGFNVHPSLLPRFRGPDPLFWTYFSDERRTGVTVHQLADAFDAGATLGQIAFDIPDELPGDQLEVMAARTGADLLVDVVAQFGSGCIDPRPQDEQQASYQSWPTTADLIIEQRWSVQHTLNFIAGVVPLGYTPRVKTRRGTFSIRRARRSVASSESPAEYWFDEQTVRLAVADGTVQLEIDG